MCFSALIFKLFDPASNVGVLAWDVDCFWSVTYAALCSYEAIVTPFGDVDAPGYRVNAFLCMCLYMAGAMASVRRAFRTTHRSSGH